MARRMLGVMPMKTSVRLARVCGLIGTNGLETRSFAANREALLRAAGTSLGCSGDRVRDVCVR